MANSIIEIFVYVVIAWAYLSFAISIFVLLTDPRREDIFGVPIIFFHIPAFIALVVLLSSGFEKLLFFIPANWMTESNDNWYSARESYARVIAFFASIGVVFLSAKYSDMKNELEAKKEKQNKTTH